jgi:tRNA-(ms[2]io[6]A)-hydroxylase
MTTKSGDGKRHLPLAPKVDVAVEGDEDRPPWHWSAIGAVGVFVLWLPLAFAASALLGRAEPGPLLVVLNAAAFAIASFGAGYLVGRFGGKAGRREATVSGGAAGTIAWMLAASQGVRRDAVGLLTWMIVLAIIVGLGSAASRVGGALGVAHRKS